MSSTFLSNWVLEKMLMETESSYARMSLPMYADIWSIHNIEILPPPEVEDLVTHYDRSMEE
jgi:hypothetical protein